VGRISRLTVTNFRSIKEPVELEFPRNAPLVLLGPNNSGKSSIVRALELIAGETWPNSFDPDDHDFHCRDKSNVPISISLDLEAVFHYDKYKATRQQVVGLTLSYSPDSGSSFRMAFSDGVDSPYVTKEVRAQCPCIVVGADRRLSYQLSYASKYTFLAKLMRQFHRALTAEEERVEALKKRFGEIKHLFQGVEPFKMFAAELQRQVDDFSSNIEYRLGVDFSAYDPSNYFHALRVLPEQGGQVRTFEELGTGQEQILALSFAYAYAKAFHGQGDEGLILVIEEPEAHLHPLAQRWVGRKIYELAKEGVQVVITTHSPAFVDVENLEALALVSKQDMATTATQLTKTMLAEHCQATGATKAEPESILPFYAVTATEEILSGLFARKIVLVEGPTEALALPVYFTRTGLNPTKEGIAFIPVHGVGNLAKWWRFFSAYHIPTYVVFDNDSKEDAKGERREDLLLALGIPRHKWSGVMRSDKWVILDHFAVFGNNFEECLRTHFGQTYDRLEQEAQKQFGLTASQSKPLIARYVAEKMTHRRGEDWKGWTRIRTMASAVRSLTR